MNKQLIDLADAAKMIREADRILFFLHVSPDGDSIGSTLAMVHALRQMGKEAIGVGVDPVPRIFHFLPGWERLFVPWQQVEGEWDLACFLDCGDLERVGDALPIVRKAKVNLNIDHHITNTVYGDFNYLDFTAAAVGEQAYLLLRQLGAPVDPEAALCLYTSIVTDTGGFRYESTSAQTHRITAELIEYGAMPYEVASQIYENESIARLAILSHALATLQVDPGGKIAWMQVTRQMLAQTGAQDEDVEGLVNSARSITGVEVGLLFKEAVDGRIRVGLRSRSSVDVGAVAKQFGGGGHARAAGCTVAAGIDEAVHQVLAAVRTTL